MTVNNYSRIVDCHQFTPTIAMPHQHQDHIYFDPQRQGYATIVFWQCPCGKIHPFNCSHCPGCQVSQYGKESTDPLIGDVLGNLALDPACRSQVVHALVLALTEKVETADHMGDANSIREIEALLTTLPPR
jgi:hypothetical protein